MIVTFEGHIETETMLDRQGSMSFWIGASIENLLFYGFDIHTGWGEDTDLAVTGAQ